MFGFFKKKYCIECEKREWDLEEVVDLIVDRLSVEQLEQLSSKNCRTNEKIDFRELMISRYRYHHPKSYPEELMVEKITMSISEFKPFFENKSKFGMHLFLEHFENRLFISK